MRPVFLSYITEFQVTPHPTRDPCRAAQLMLPYAHNLPPRAAKLAINKTISFSVVGNFGVPKFLIAPRSLVALRATVPKAAIHEHNNSFAPKGEIRLAEKWLVAPPTGDAVPPEDFDQAQLCGRVSLGPDQRHYLRPFLLAPNIGHIESTGCGSQQHIKRNGIRRG